MAKQFRKNIGEIIKKYRLAANMSQMALAEKIGISYQQLQKYEKGINNISVYRLEQIAEALKIPISSFLETEEPEKIAEDIGEYGLSKEEKTLLDQTDQFPGPGLTELFVQPVDLRERGAYESIGDGTISVT